MKRFDLKRMPALLLALSMALGLAACGGSGGNVSAASMWLVKTEGAVAVTDDTGADVSLTERLGLFSGYGVATRDASYGWIDLDETKLAKLDENSDVAVQKDGKDLTLTVNSGSLFFNVAEPLAEDETMKIRSANMVTAIRGTCGWIEVPDAEHMNVYILEGTVECSAGEATESVTAGQTAALNAAEGTVTVKSFTAADVPAFVIAEVTQDEALAAAILDASGLDLSGSASADGESAESEADAEQVQALLRQAGYLGDPTASTMTADQAAQLGAALRQLAAQSEAAYLNNASLPQELQCYAVLFDAGDGSPAAAFLNNGTAPYDIFPDYAGLTVLHFRDGQMVRMHDAELMGLALNDRYVRFSGYLTPDGSASDVRQNWVYDLSAGGLHGEVVSLCTEDEYGPGGITIDGAPATQEQYNAWGSRWAGAGWTVTFSIGNGGSGGASGAQDAAALADLLNSLAPAGSEPALPVDGDRLVLSGTLNEYDYGQTVALQGMSDPAGAWADTSRTYWIIVLDGPQTIEITAGDSSDLRAGETGMISILDPSGLEAYAGQHIIFSIDPQTSYWQSDASMPMGAARTNDIHVLG